MQRPCTGTVNRVSGFKGKGIVQVLAWGPWSASPGHVLMGGLDATQAQAAHALEWQVLQRCRAHGSVAYCALGNCQTDARKLWCLSSCRADWYWRETTHKVAALQKDDCADVWSAGWEAASGGCLIAAGPVCG